MYKEGDTFWLHICPHKPESREYLPVGKTCKLCDWYELPEIEKTKIRQREYRERLEQDYDY
jgi:hypothetical protein